MVFPKHRLKLVKRSLLEKADPFSGEKDILKKYTLLGKLPLVLVFEEKVSCDSANDVSLIPA